MRILYSLLFPAVEGEDRDLFFGLTRDGPWSSLESSSSSDDPSRSPLADWPLGPEIIKKKKI